MVTESRVWYVVHAIAEWKNLELNFGAFPMGPRQLNSIGFLPVFDGIEAAEKYRDEVCPGAMVKAIRETTAEAGN